MYTRRSESEVLAIPSPGQLGARAKHLAALPPKFFGSESGARAKSLPYPVQASWEREQSESEALGSLPPKKFLGARAEQ